MKFPIRLARVCALLCFASFPCPAAPAQSPPPATLASVLARHAQASQTAGARRDRSPMQTVYDIQAGGLMGTLSEWAVPPAKSRVEMTLGPLHQIDADDGATAWQQDATGNVRVVTGAERAAGRAAQSFSIDGYDPLRPGKGGRVLLRPKREAGTGDYILDVLPSAGPPSTVYLDPHTFLVRKMIASKGGIAGTIVINAYTTVAGEKVPSRLTIGYAGLPIVVTATLREAKRVAHLDASLFAVPASARDYGFLNAGNAGPVTVPFTDDGSEIVIPVQINGQKRLFLLDSGAGNSFITGTAAQSLGLTPAGTLPALGYGKPLSTGVASHARIEVGGALWMDGQSLYVLPDPKLAQMLTDHGGVDGGLGYDVLARFRVTIDYARKTLTFHAATDPLPPMPGAQVLPLSLENHVPTVTATLDGTHRGRFLVDTGDSGSLHLYSRFARAAGLRHYPHSVTQTGTGIGGQVSEFVSPNHKLTLGRATLSGLRVATSDGAGISQISLLAGGIGNQILRHYVVTLDYAGQRLFLQSGAASPTPAVATAPAAAPAPLPPTDDATRAVLAKHLAALGGAKAVSAVTSIRVTDAVETGGIKGTVVTVYAAPNKEYDHSQLGGGALDTAEGFDGKTAWRRDTNGNIRPLGDDETRELKLQLYVDTNSYVLPQFGIPGRVVLRPKREDGTGNFILDILPEGGKPSVLFLDAKTYLIAKEQHFDDNVLVVTTFADYRAVDGVQYPYRQRTTSGTAKYDILAQVLNVENNVQVPDSLFQPPAAQTGTTQFLTPGATSATVPFDLDNGEISLPVRINGSPSRVFVDSGASGLALSAKMAATLKLKGKGVLEARGYGGSTDLHPVRLDTFDIPGAVRLSNLAAVALALPEGFDRSLGDPLAGFIGYDLLSRFVVRIDYAGRKLTFIAPNSFVPAPLDGTPVALNLDNDIPAITAQFDTLPPASFLLDTGDVSALRLYGPYVTANSLSRKYPKQVPAVGGGIGGVSRSLLTRTPSLTVAGVTLRDLPTEFSLDTKGGASQVLAGSLGSQVLSRFVVTFDYPHRRVFFAPNPGAEKPYDTRTFGLIIDQASTAPGKPLVVVDIAADSPASAAGVALYDQILTIDGQSAQKMGLPEVRRLLSAAGGSSQHTLELLSTVRVQRTVTVTLYDPLS